MTRDELARMIDHTLLKPEATGEQIDRLCDEALQHGFWSVCVNPCWVSRCAERLSQPGATGLHTLVCTVAGFPLGANTSDAKAFEAKQAVEQGAREVDMVVNLGAVVAGDKSTVLSDIAAVVEATKRAKPQTLVKVILETRALADEQIAMACQCAVEARADFVKTSTGFHAGGGATAQHVALLRRHAGPLGVKASGGIRDLNSALAMVQAGANRLGVSAGVAIVGGLDQATGAFTKQAAASSY